MFQEVVTGTNVILYMMILVGTVGVLAKCVNQITLRRMVKAAGNMQKSTHKLIKLVRSKYEHACMLHDRVENVEAFVEKYIYEYRGFLFRIHTWRQLEIQTIWFAGILALLGAGAWYMENGFSEQVYRYLTGGAAEMMLLFVISQLSDEHHKILRVRNYMVDYLENVCAFRQRKIRQTEREQINVIQSENAQGRAGKSENVQGRASQLEGAMGRSLQSENIGRAAQFESVQGRTAHTEAMERTVQMETASIDYMPTRAQMSDEREEFADRLSEYAEKNIVKENQTEGKNLSIRIEGEPRKAGKGELAKKVFGKQDREQEEVQPSVQEETIRKILEEFLA